MKKISPVIWKTAYRIGIIAVFVQIALGICWAVCNFLAVPDFPETKLLLEMSESWALDEYAGPGYVLLLFLTRALQRAIGLPYQCVVYFLQFGFACFAVCRLLHSVLSLSGKKIKVRFLLLTGLFVNTIPFALQSHFSVLPYSPAGGCYLLVLAEILGVVGLLNKTVADKKSVLVALARLIVVWSMSALLMPEYLYLSGGLCLFGLLYAGLINKSFRGIFTMTVAAGVLVGGMLLVASTQEGSRDRMQNTIEAQAVRRMCWSELYIMKGVWHWDILKIFSEDELMYSAAAPERVIDFFGSKLERAVGKDAANFYYADMAKRTLQLNTKKVVEQFAADIGFYLCPQGVAFLNLSGTGATYTGQNYEKMQDCGGVFARLLVRWSETTMVLLGLSGVLTLLQAKEYRFFCGVMALGLISQALCWAWLTAGRISYLVCPANMSFWGIVLTAWLWAKSKREADTE